MKSGSNSGLIYGLVDPRTACVRYVGKSERGLMRANEHRYPASLRRLSAKNKWILELFAQNLDYTVVELDSCVDCTCRGHLSWWVSQRNFTALNDLEVWWIAFGNQLGWELLNATIGGDGSTGYKYTPEQRRKLSEARKGISPSPATLLRMSEATKRQFADPVFRAAHSGRIKTSWESEDLKKRQRDTHLGKTQHTDEHKAKLKQRMSGDNNPAKQPGVGAKISATKMGHAVSEEQKAKTKATRLRKKQGL